MSCRKETKSKQVKVECSKCDGSGKSESRRCTSCDGSGNVRIKEFQGGYRTISCSSCNNGWVTSECDKCRGAGYSHTIPEYYEVELDHSYSDSGRCYHCGHEQTISSSSDDSSNSNDDDKYNKYGGSDRWGYVKGD